MERLKDGNVELRSWLLLSLSFYVRKWRLLLVLNLTKYKIQENKEKKVKKNIKKISA